MTTFEIASLTINTISSVAIVASAIYVALQFRRAAKIHEQNLEWNKRIENRKKLDDYNRLDSALYLNERFKFVGRKHSVPIDEITKAIEDDHQVEVHLSRLLNYYEAIALGIENNFYDEYIVKSTRRGAMIRTFTAFEEYIAYDRREHSPMTYIKYEAIVKKWIDEERKEQGLPPTGKVCQCKSVSVDGYTFCSSVC